MNLGHVGFLAESERDDLARDRRADRRPRLPGRGADDARRRGRGGRPGRAPHLGAQRGQRGEGQPGADARGGARGRRPPGRSSSAATGSSWPPRPARPPTRSPPAARWSGRRSRRCCWCRSARTRCSPGRSWSAPTSVLAVELVPLTRARRAVLWCDGRRSSTCCPGCPGRGAPLGSAGAPRPARPAAVHRPAGGQVRPAGARLARHGAPTTAHHPYELADRLAPGTGRPARCWRRCGSGGSA